MGEARAAILCEATVVEAEAAWWDVSRWPSFVDGCAQIDSVDDAWPAVGSAVTWSSTPAGRGRVVERLRVRRPGEGAELEVEDDRLRGVQWIGFAPATAGRCEATLELDYRLARSGPATALLDLLFVRRALTDSLRRTVTRFAAELDRTDWRGR